MENEKSLQEVLRENKENYRRKQMVIMKRQQRKERILATIIGTFIIISTLTIMFLLSEKNMKDIESCSLNNDLEICIKNA